MNIDIDQVAAVAEVQERAIAWELSLTLGGAEYQVRPLANADLMALGRVQQMSEAQLRSFLDGLFLEPRPDLQALIYGLEDEALAARRLSAIVLGVMQGFQEHAKKKSEVISALVRRELDRPMSGR